MTETSSKTTCGGYKLADLHERFSDILSLVLEWADSSRGLAGDEASLIKELRRRHAFSLCVDSRYGGIGASWSSMMYLSRSVSRFSPSAGWLINTANAHAMIVSRLESTLASTILDRDSLFVATASCPSDVVIERTDGGVKINGAWRYCSGVELSTSVLLTILFEEKQYFFPLHEGDYRIVDDSWHSTGLVATGSKDLIVKDLFVPFAHLCEKRDTFRKNPLQSQKNDEFDILPSILAAVTSPIVGTTIGLVGHYLSKVDSLKVKPRSNSAFANMLVGLDSVIRDHNQLIQEFCISQTSSDGFDPFALTMARLRSTRIASICRDIAMEALDLYGINRTFDDNLINKLWNDLQSMAYHIDINRYDIPEQAGSFLANHCDRISHHFDALADVFTS